MKNNHLQIYSEWLSSHMCAFGIVSGFQAIFSVHPGAFTHSELTQELRLVTCFSIFKV